MTVPLPDLGIVSLALHFRLALNRVKSLPRLLKLAVRLLLETLITSLPNGPYTKLRVRYWRSRGYAFARTSYIARNVYFLGDVTLGEGSSISNNCFVNGSHAGIRIGNKVMIAPNCVLVAFDHGYCDLTLPMIEQPLAESPVVIEDDVWIGANCTITKGVRLGRGCIVGANSVVVHDVPPYLIVGGVPARQIGARK